MRLHLEYCIQFWSPINAKGEGMLEGVQKRATKMIQSLKNLSYEERLKRLGIFSLNEDENGRTRKHSLCLKIRRHLNSNIELNFWCSSKCDLP